MGVARKHFLSQMISKIFIRNVRYGINSRNDEITIEQMYSINHSLNFAPQFECRSYNFLTTESFYFCQSPFTMADLPNCFL